MRAARGDQDNGLTNSIETIGTTDEADSDESDDKSQNSAANQGETKDKKKVGLRKSLKDEKIDVNTNTKVQMDSKAKRNKLDEAVRKILLYKDMKASDVKGDMDSNVKLN